MRGGRPLPLVLAMASAAVAGLGVRVTGAPLMVVDEDMPPRRRAIPKVRYRLGGSLAGHSHEHNREIDRRLRQQSRDAERQGARLACLGKPTQAPVDIRDRRFLVGISRRGRYLFA